MVPRISTTFNQKKMSRLLLIICISIFLQKISDAQILEPGQPKSFSADFLQKSMVFEQLIPPADVKNVEKMDGSPIIALPILTNFSLTKNGVWTEFPNGDRVWQMAVESQNARGFIFLFDQFLLPAEARFFVFDEQKTTIIGAFSQKSCLTSEKMTIGPIRGNRVILELFEPFSVKNQSKIELSRVDYVFDQSIFNQNQAESGAEFGSSLACNININCPQAIDWQTQKKAVARVMMVLAQGTGFCSGTLLNQVSADKKPYFLTGFHCMDGYTPLYDQWKFDFNYESTTCTNPATEPVAQSIVGCNFRAGRQQSDFLLLELNPIPVNFPIFLAGWNRSATDLATNSVFVHHPKGDIKKWSKDNQTSTIFPQTISWNNNVISPANTHFSTVTDLGTFEVGSSGCALFDQNKRVVGNLHGGNTAVGNGCSVTNAWFGRFSTSWDAGTTAATRLKDWLDPANTAVLTLDGTQPPVIQLVTLSGNVKTVLDSVMPNVKIYLGGAKTDSVFTNAMGNFSFQIEPNKTYTVRPFRDENFTNGLSVFDIVELSKHVLNVVPFTNPAKWIAGNINGNGAVTTADIVELRKMILGIYTNFPQNTSWRFWSASFVFPNPPVPSSLPASVEIPVGTTNISGVNFLGVKIGDVGFSADPKN
jgi:lysyl endopeptidase